MKHIRNLLFTIGLMALFAITLIPTSLGSPPTAVTASNETITQPIAPATQLQLLAPATVYLNESSSEPSGFEATSNVLDSADASPPASSSPSLM